MTDAFWRKPARPAVVWGLAALAAGLNFWMAFGYGADFRDFLSGGRRFLAGTNLYEGSGAYNGMIGPPFQAVLHAPFAAIEAASPAAAIIAWATLSFACLVAGVWCWARALRVAPASLAVVVTAIALWFAFYREFQSQNMTALLMLLMGVAALAWTRRIGDLPGGVAIGVATALKLFPGFLLLFAIARRRWSMAVAAGLTAGVCTVLPVLRYGVTGFWALWMEWLRTRRESVWPADFQSQSITHVVRLWWPGDHAALAATVAFAIVVGLVLLLAWRLPDRRDAPADDLALAATMSVLASPIAWIGYWVIVWPAVIVVAREAPRRRSARSALAVIAIAGAVLGPLTRDAPTPQYLLIGLVSAGLVGYWLWRDRAGAAASVAS
jgi:alpha-1,2-mannosyltransferase